ncbi:MAG TPA: S8/S53 family peptidase [Longimicrobium sp.]|nr:S8/S53 family peptidase [Longimicrobium sp.]
MQSLFRPFGRPALAGCARWLAAPMIAVPLLLGACDDHPLPLQPADEPAVASLVASPTVRTARGDLVTGDASLFAQALAEIGPEGKVLIWIKDTGTARPTPEFLINLPGTARETIALPADAPGAARRNDLGPGSVRGASLQAVVRALGQAGVEDPNPMEALGVISARLPERVRLAALQVLLRHPNVDYVSAVRARPVEFNSAPTGLNLADTKHTVHKVLDVWNVTRGLGIRVGILDSGLARISATGGFHQDALFTSSQFGDWGVIALGFIDDGCDKTAANNGACIAYDDHGHGSAMVGLVGANDNDFPMDAAGVGIAPYATTYSMKIAWNTYIHGDCGSWGDENIWCIEDDDFLRSINYAAAKKLHVLSMSFKEDGNSDIYRAMSTAYHTHGVFLLASTGNTMGGSAQQPASYDVVMGVGGVDAAGNNLYSTASRDVSGFAGGVTLAATCYKSIYCDAGLPSTFGETGGTSAATANVAGVVALVRAVHPTETPAQIWQRIVASADGPNRVVNALAAINWQRPL